MAELFAELIGNILCIIEDLKFWKKKKARRKFEKENNLPKKLMINPIWKLAGIFLIFIIVARLVIGYLFFADYGATKTAEKIAEIELILEKEKKEIGTYPTELKNIIRNNPLRKNITFDHWKNEYYYKQLENGLSYVLISKGKDGILKTEDDISGNKNLP
ncbi:hypothetical protein [Gelidibacter mesophilus]|uniref:hypothetical protein n=1 Tax=Gelidibacter mesophilus TaxID=169050 RepID=UPI000408600E|nr:hypothetical protein [Gelidibacter mesophilus]